MKRITFGRYAGVRIKGKSPMKDPDTYKHIDYASWLTAHVESGGRFGCVINYDGTGITAGIHQAILVYPRALDDNKKNNDQGPLWELLARLQALPLLPMGWNDINSMLSELKWMISSEGKCRNVTTGKLISGQAIRKEINGAANGCMPGGGPDQKRVEKWARAFHTVFSDPNTFPIQLAYGEEHFIKRAERVKLHRCKKKEYRGLTIQEACYIKNHISAVTNYDLGPMDLAMSVFWSHTVNAPAITLKKLCRIVDRMGSCTSDNEDAFARAILKSLANSGYGRWNDEIKNGRWHRTRSYAMKVWPAELFTPSGLMPKKVVG